MNPVLYRTNRDRLVQALRNLKALENVKNPIVLLKGGESTYRYCCKLIFFLIKLNLPIDE